MVVTRFINFLLVYYISKIIIPFVTREYAKRSERVIGMDGNFTPSIHHSDVNSRSLITQLISA